MNIDIEPDEVCSDCGSYVFPSHCPMCCSPLYLPIGLTRYRVCGWCTYAANPIETIDTKGRT